MILFHVVMVWFEFVSDVLLNSLILFPSYLLVVSSLLIWIFTGCFFIFSSFWFS